MKKVSLSILFVLLFIGCATIKTYRILEQPQGKILTASIGSTIFRLNKSSDLPNVFGKADLYGGKVNKGYSELKLKGISNKGILLLQITDLNLTSTETTMDRYGPAPRVNVESEISIGSSTPLDYTVFEFDLNKEKELVIARVKVTFIDTKTYSVTYVLEDNKK